jgi:ArsR family transcriptional regulator, arsenate/arsenite/antimonite-responsive transcriptional repressor
MVLLARHSYPVVMADIFDVVADVTRRDLLQVLLERHLASNSPVDGISVGQLVEKLGISQPTVSKHLKVLRDIGLVRVREGGQHRYYSIDSSPLEEIEDWLIPFLASDAVGAVEDEPTAEDASAAVYAAWAGAPLTASVRRVAGRLPQAGEAGTAVGRAVADVSYQARAVLEDASARVDRVNKRLTKQGRSDDE